MMSKHNDNNDLQPLLRQEKCNVITLLKKLVRHDADEKVQAKVDCISMPSCSRYLHVNVM